MSFGVKIPALQSQNLRHCLGG